MSGSHDAVRDRIAAKFLDLPDFTCGFCGSVISFPTGYVCSVETEYTYSSQPRLRADIAALGGVGEIAAIVEVILTSKPSERALAAHEDLPFVSYVEMNQQAVYCSPFCWRNQGTENLCDWSVPRCDMCERPFHQTFSETVWRDWDDDSHYGLCLECAAGITAAQWRSPGEVIGGTGISRWRRHCRAEVPGVHGRGVLGVGLGGPGKVPERTLWETEGRERDGGATGRSRERFRR